MIKKGGKVLGSGGYGCVFFPALKCKGGVRPPNKISKLMLRNVAQKEYDTIVFFKNSLRDIPNYQKYFLLDDIELCEVDKLTNDDKKSFDTKCRALLNKGFTSSNINSKLNEVYALQMPDGGIDIEHFLQKGNNNSKKLFALNNALIELLQNGIYPMNMNGVYHADIKTDNILVKVVDGVLNARIIDWGLSYLQQGTEISRSVVRPLSFNLPMSILICHPIFYSYKIKMKDIFNRAPSSSLSPIKVMLNDYLKKQLSIPTHIDYMGLMLNKLTKNFDREPMNRYMSAFSKDFGVEPFTDNVMIFYYFMNYFTKICMFYLTKKEENYYYNEVILKNMDIIGLITCYYSIFEILDSKTNKTSTEKRLIEKLRTLLLNKLFVDVNEINRKRLLEDLNEIGDLMKRLEGSVPRLSLDGKMMEIKENMSDQEKELELRISKIRKEDSLSASRSLSDSDSDTDTDIMSLTGIKTCPPGKELNPRTNRCVNVCKEGFERDKNFKCRGTRKRGRPKQDRRIERESANKKVCPEGKRLNPYTNRCVKKCIPGYVRDINFRCKKSRIIRGRGRPKKTESNRTSNLTRKRSLNKVCPDGKVLNPNTNRCVKVCKEGYIRDENFICKSVRGRGRPPKNKE